MNYKTICLGLLEQHPEIYDQLRQRRMLLPTLNRLASELKARHHLWMQELQATRPGSDSQIASEAIEIALKELQDGLLSGCSSEEENFATLNDWMSFLRAHTPPA